MPTVLPIAPSALIEAVLGPDEIQNLAQFMGDWRRTWSIAMALQALDNAFSLKDGAVQWDRGAYETLVACGAGFVVQMAHAHAERQPFWKASLWRVPEARIGLSSSLNWLASELGKVQPPTCVTV